MRRRETADVLRAEDLEAFLHIRLLVFPHSEPSHSSAVVERATLEDGRTCGYRGCAARLRERIERVLASEPLVIAEARAEAG